MKLYTKREAAALCGFEEAWIAKQIRDKKLVATKFGRHVRINSDDLERFMVEAREMSALDLLKQELRLA